MNATIAGLLRHVLTTLGGVLAAKGVIAASDVELVAGALVAILGVVWSVVEKRRRGTAP